MLPTKLRHHENKVHVYPNFDRFTLINLYCLKGIHLIARSGSRLSYTIYNLTTGKVEQDATFPTDAQTFLGENRSDITLHNTGDVSFVEKRTHVIHVIISQLHFYK